MNNVTVELDESQRQTVLLALAELSLARPGWVNMLEEIAFKMDNHQSGRAEMFEAFRQNHITAAVHKLTEG